MIETNGLQSSTARDKTACESGVLLLINISDFIGQKRLDLQLETMNCNRPLVVSKPGISGIWSHNLCFFLSYGQLRCSL